MKEIGNLRNVGTPGQKKATRALAKFCREHKHATNWVNKLEEFEEALNKRDVEQLQNTIALIRRAGMGSFHDWFPSVTYEHEDEECVTAIWYGLYGYWREMVGPIEKVKNA